MLIGPAPLPAPPNFPMSWKPLRTPLNIFTLILLWDVTYSQAVVCVCVCPCVAFLPFIPLASFCSFSQSSLR